MRVLRTRHIEQIDQGFSARAIKNRQTARSRAAFWLIWVQLSDVGKRIFDLGVSSALLAFLGPIWLILEVLNLNKAARLIRSPMLGRWGCIFNKYSFSSGPLSGLPALINVWRGDMSIIGPRPVAPAEVASCDRPTWKRFDVRPGLLCLWWIRVRANIAYGTEALADAEYVDSHSLMSDLGIALRAVPASVYGRGVALAPSRVDLIGIPINNLTMDEAIETILEKCRADKPSQVCFLNADCANIAWHNKAYTTILSSCGLVLADGIGIKLAGTLLNRNIRQNVNGTDMLPLLCEALQTNGLGIYLLGGRPGVAADVANWMRKTFPTLLIRGYQHGYFEPAELPDILEHIRHSGAEMLLVAFGVPKQERWIRDHLTEAGVKVAIGVGGLFDFYSGRVRRAPVWMREAGMEWLFRFWQEPRRMWRRYFVGNVLFLARVFRDRSRSSVSP